MSARQIDAAGGFPIMSDLCEPEFDTFRLIYEAAIKLRAESDMSDSNAIRTALNIYDSLNKILDEESEGNPRVVA